MPKHPREIDYESFKVLNQLRGKVESAENKWIKIHKTQMGEPIDVCGKLISTWEHLRIICTRDRRKKTERKPADVAQSIISQMSKNDFVGINEADAKKASTVIHTAFGDIVVTMLVYREKNQLCLIQHPDTHIFFLREDVASQRKMVSKFSTTLALDIAKKVNGDLEGDHNNVIFIQPDPRLLGSQVSLKHFPGPGKGVISAHLA